MKYLLLILACLLIGISGTTRADAQGIEVLSQQYHIQGSIWGDIETYDPLTDSYHYDPYSDSYDEVSVAPISKDISWENAYSSSSASLFSISQYSDSWSIHGTKDATALVDATWTFKPLTSNLEVTFNHDEGFDWGHFYCNFTAIWLTDITESSVLFSTSSENWYYESWNRPPDSYSSNRNGGWETYKLSVDLTHEYSLRILSHSESQGYDTDYWSGVDATFVPEPATLLLLTLGGLILRRRK